MQANGTPAASAAAHVLIVDDDGAIADLLVRYLQSHGLRASRATDGQALRRTRLDGVDLVLLDLGLPGEDGLDLLEYLRGAWGGPVIVVSGRGESVDRTVGLELGADDYVAKPFDLRELLARIRSVLRRARAHAGGADGSRYAFAGMLLDPASRSLLDAQGRQVDLTSGEFDLLMVLVERAQRVLDRDQLTNALHHRDAGPFDRAIDVRIARLRRKLEPDPAHPRVIKSVRGAGYVLAVDVSRA